MSMNGVKLNQSVKKETKQTKRTTKEQQKSKTITQKENVTTKKRNGKEIEIRIILNQYILVEKKREKVEK